MAEDYSGKNLRGHNFKGQNLAGANFSYADIRGANFTNANLTGANFTGAKAGLPKHWVVGLLILSLLVSALSGFFATTAGVSAVANVIPKDTQTFTLLAAVVVLAMSIVLLMTLLSNRLTPNSGTTVGNLISRIMAVIGAIFGATAGAITLISTEASISAFTLIGIVIVVLGQVLATGLSLTRFVAEVIAGTLAGVSSLCLVVIGSAIGALLMTEQYAVILVTATSGLAALIGNYCSRGALNGNPKWALTRIVGTTIAATGGTSFYGANLTDADFTQATLKNTDFRKANLTRTRFYEVKKLDYARAGNTILSNLAILKLLVSGNSREKSYAGFNLKGANLTGFDFKAANFKDADISDATFQDANLEWANLTLTQAIGTDFTSAQMTGACVEAWNINSTTKLDNVDCRFVYLLENPKPGTDDRERRPSSGDFQQGEFTKLFEEVLNTVDLIFRNGVDWKAFVAAFKQVQVENEGTELALQSIENKGDGVIVVKVSVPIDADKEKIHSDFNHNYQIALKEVEKRYKAELQAKDREIQIYRQQSVNMQAIVGLLASRPIDISIEATSTSDSKSMTDSRKTQVNQNNSSFGVGYSEQVTSQQIGGTIHNYAAQQNLAEAAREIQQLLQQLEQNYPTDTLVQKAVVVEEAIKQIEGNPELKQRVIGAIKAGGIEAFKELTDHPLINILLEAWKGWQEPDE